jgi:putative hemolysin
MLEVAILVVLILVNGVFAMSETALVSARQARLQERAEDGDSGAAAALELAGSPNRFLSTVQIGISLVGVLAGAFGGATLAGPVADLLRGVPLLAPYADALAFGGVVVGITYLSLILGELVPKRLALNAPEVVASRISRLMRFISVIAAPAVWFLGASTEAVLRLLPGGRKSEEPPVTDAEIEILLDSGTQAGVFEEAERDLVGNVFRLGDRRVREIMTPRPQVVWLDTDDPPEEHWRKVISSRHSYFPVAHGDLDDLLGLTSIKDALARASLGSGSPPDLTADLLQPAFVPENAPALGLLETFERSGLRIAVVVDERGVFEGIVTLADVLEAIVGDLPDADEPDEGPSIVRREDGSWLVDGLLLADVLKDHLDLRELPREDEDLYQTVGGLVVTQLERIPTTGDGFVWEGLRFEVVDMDGRRVDKVLVSPVGE